MFGARHVSGTTAVLTRGTDPASAIAPFDQADPRPEAHVPADACAATGSDVRATEQPAGRGWSRDTGPDRRRTPNRSCAARDHRRGGRQEGTARRDHSGPGLWTVEEACPSVPRPQGHQGSLPPRREGLRQLRPDLRPLPLEVPASEAAARKPPICMIDRAQPGPRRSDLAPARFDRKHRLTYSSERRAMLVGVRPSSQAPVMAATGSPRIRTARSAYGGGLR